MRIIIVGCGKVGITLAEQLGRDDDDITVIDLDYKKVQRIANEYDVMGVAGNGATYTTLSEAGVEESDVLIAVTGSDELNLLCCLIAKKAGGCKVIARVRNPEYSSEVNFIKEKLGLAMIINPEFAAAREMARVFRFPSAIKIDTFAKGRVELLRFKVPAGSVLHDMSLMDMSSRLKCDVLVCIVERGEEVQIPSGSFVLKERDIVSFIATPRNASTFFKKIGVVTNQVKNALLVGGGDISYYLAAQLLHMNINVKMIEQDLDRCNELSALLPDATVIHGDGTDQSLLMEEGLPFAEGFAALTNMDEENILLSLFAKRSSKAKTITKINRITFDEVIDSLDLDSTVYPKYVTANSILQFVRAMKNSIGSNVETLYRLLDGRVEALEFAIKEASGLVDVPLERLQLKPNILIACIHRHGKVIIPRGQDKIELGDTLIVVTTNIGMEDVRNLLK